MGVSEGWIEKNPPSGCLGMIAFYNSVYFVARWCYFSPFISSN